MSEFNVNAYVYAGTYGCVTVYLITYIFSYGVNLWNSQEAITGSLFVTKSIGPAPAFSKYNPLLLFLKLLPKWS